MGFFKKLFGKENNKPQTQSQSQSKPQKSPAAILNSEPKQAPGTFNNFKEYGLPNIPLGLSGVEAIDTMSVIAGFSKGMEAENKDCEVSGFMFVKLFDEGAARIPFVFKSGGKGYAMLFVYDEAGAKTFNLIKELMADSEYPNVLYISRVDCKNIVEKASNLDTFGFKDLSCDKDVTLTGEYGMWWSEEDDQSFPNSQTRIYLDEIVESIKGYESYMLGYMLYQMQIDGFKEFNRVGLPEEDRTFPVKGPEYKTVLVSSSKEKGIRFHFPVKTTTKAYRERFLDQMKSCFISTQTILKTKNIPQEPPTDPNGYDWFKFMTSVLDEKTKAGKENDVAVIGALNYD